MSAALADADLENAAPGDFGGLDASDAGLQTALTVLAVLADDVSDVAEVVRVWHRLTRDIRRYARLFGRRG